METNAFYFLINAEKITVINPYCKKKNAKQSSKKVEFSSAKTQSLLMLNSNCQNNFQLPFIESKATIQDLKFSTYSYLPQKLLELYKDQHLPPPKLS